MMAAWRWPVMMATWRLPVMMAAVRWPWRVLGMLAAGCAMKTAARATLLW